MRLSLPPTPIGDNSAAPRNSAHRTAPTRFAVCDAIVPGRIRPRDKEPVEMGRCRKHSRHIPETNKERIAVICLSVPHKHRGAGNPVCIAKERVDMAKLDAIRKRLEDRLRELTDETQEIGSELRKPLDADADERAIELEDDEVLEELGNTALEESEEIRKALRRIDSGTYGICAQLRRQDQRSPSRSRPARGKLHQLRKLSDLGSENRSGTRRYPLPITRNRP